VVGEDDGTDSGLVDAFVFSVLGSDSVDFEPISDVDND
jgi:hypothetical protein